MGSSSLLPISHAPKPSAGGSSSLLPLQHPAAGGSSVGAGVGGGSIASKSLPAVATMQKLIMTLGETMREHSGFNDHALHARNTINPQVMLSVGKAENIDGQESWKTDGMWGRHTDAGLAEALKLAEAIEKAHAELNLPGDPFVSEQLKSLIPENFSKASSEVADKLSSELKALYEDYLRDLQGAISQHTDKKEDFYSKTHEDEVVMKLPGGVPLKLSDLASVQAFAAALQRAYPHTPVDVEGRAKSLLAQLGHAPANGKGVAL
jgi:hypothetical protein